MRSGKDEAQATMLADRQASEIAKQEYHKSCVDVLQAKLTRASWMHHCAVSQKGECAFASCSMATASRIVDDRAINALIELTESTFKESEVLKVIWASVQVVRTSASVRANGDQRPLGVCSQTWI